LLVQRKFFEGYVAGVSETTDDISEAIRKETGNVCNMRERKEKKGKRDLKMDMGSNCESTPFLFNT
jgi:hypothetical protein